MEYVYKIEFLFPPGVMPKAVPLSNVTRKDETLTIYFNTVPDAEGIKRIVSWANGIYVNPAPEIIAKLGGLRYNKYKKTNEVWEIV